MTYSLRLLTLLVFAPGCSHSKQEMREARSSAYDVEFAAVYTAALEETRTLYPNLDDNPRRGRISTAWHEVKMASMEEDLSGQRSVSTATGAQGSAGQSEQSAGAQPGARFAMKRFFIRFDVTVSGGRPWRVKIAPHAASWDTGAAMPTELRGDAAPPWLTPRADALRLVIHRRIRAFAVPYREPAPLRTVHLPSADPSRFSALPAGAAKLLADLRAAIVRRDYARLRELLPETMIWSDGGGSGADAAISVWQADPTSFATIDRCLDNCVVLGNDRAECTSSSPAGRVIAEKRAGSWVLSEIVVL